MRRRDMLLSGMGAGTALAASTLAKPAIAQSMPEIKWRMTSSFPKSLDTIFGTAQQLAKLVAEATDNRFQIQTFAAGEIVPGLQALDAVSSGALECCHTPTYFYGGKDPVLGFGTGMPFGPNARLQHAWWHNGGGAEIVNESLAKFNAISFAAGNSGTQMGGWFRKEINTLDDLKGLKFRIGGTGGQILGRMGVVPQQIAPADIYPALEKGTIDAIEFVGPYDDEKLGFSKVAKYYYYPGFWEGGAMLHLVVNIEQWNRLPKHYQAIIRQASEAANNWMLSKYDTVNAPALKRLVGRGTELRPFSAAIMDSAYETAKTYYSEIAAQNPLFKKALDSVNAYLGEQYLWWQVGEYSYDSMMIRTRLRG
ncbi:MAG: TRAP transporter substrate-binding protein DctP [Beijerinckiaceae bacterium]|jgi:TRAP-type mannitol/chloroaromatic compound transport system substrate-binding protein|nr:TRAP transporter substrate-binding protein DctP [Beijerinckiaceae bacterium]